jgi:hypothetical protein
MISKLTTENIRNFTLDGGTLDLDGGSHSIFLVKRNDLDDLSGAYIKPISADVSRRLTRRINRLQWLERIDLYHSFASVNESRAMAGLVYESLGHAILQEGTRLIFKPMVRTYARKLYHWKAPGEEQTTNPDSSEITVDFPSNTAIVYRGAGTPIRSKRLYVPKARNQPAIDSFFLFKKKLFIFQLTVANTHDIKRGIEGFFAGRVDIPPKTDWRFVFITPGSEVTVKATPDVKNFLEEVTLYLAHLEIEEQTLSSDEMSDAGSNESNESE